jgi:hypothetical protein
MGKHQSNVPIKTSLQFTSHSSHNSFLTKHIKNTLLSMFRNLQVEILIITILIFSYLLISCSSTKRFTSDEDITGKEVYKEEIKLNDSAVRVLLDEKPEALYITIRSKV